ncbi:MAG TPA: flagellar basal body P-ring formation protein FlgA [Betaproteobacteria bacterium]|nr:flagellar basal body P-ring formation protein FlgA [Betaproteobacteria bacterium]
MRRLWILLAVLIAHSAWAAAWETPAALAQAAKNFARQNAGGQGRAVEITVGLIDPRLRLPKCTQLTPFLPPGNRLWGNATVGIRCSAPSPWTIYVPLTVKVFGKVVVAARPLTPGQIIAPADIRLQRKNLTLLQAGVFSDPRVVIGKHIAGGIPAGYPLRMNMLRIPFAVTQGQIVKLIARGRGFTVNSEGRALSSAKEGQPVSVRTSNGQTISGTARIGGVVDVEY